MKSNVIYFDFDRTLLDTDALKIEQARRIAKITQLTDEQVAAGMSQYMKEVNRLDFTPEGYALCLQRMYDINPGDVLKIYVTDSNYIAEYLFPEVLQTLKELREKGYSLGIFSGAVPGHQRLKIERTGVLEFVSEPVIIHPRKLGIEALEQLPDNVIVIDDDIEVVTTLARHFPRFRPIWCNRKTADEMEKIPTIHNLCELVSLLTSLS